MRYVHYACVVICLDRLEECCNSYRTFCKYRLEYVFDLFSIGEVGSSEAEMLDKLFFFFVEFLLLPLGKSADTSGKDHQYTRATPLPRKRVERRHSHFRRLGATSPLLRSTS